MSTRIRRDVIDGVTVFWTPDAARRMGALQFRVGQSDETPSTAGVSHLVEHLALFSTERRSYQFNGAVDLVRTIFHAMGTDAELSAFFAAVTARLSALPLERLDAEMRVLRAEATNRPQALATQHLWHRYGPRGFGLPALPEFGLHTLTGPQVSAWAATRFTRGNAVAWYSGAPPDALRFALPEGPRHAPVARSEIPGLPDRIWVGSPLPGIAFGVVLTRTAAGALALRVLTQRLERRLRHERGQSYEVSLAYHPLDAAEAVGSIYASCLPDDVAQVRAEFLTVVDALAGDGPTQEEIDWEVAAYARLLQNDDSIYGALDAAAHDELLGAPLLSPEQHLEEMRALQPAAVRDAFATAVTRASLIDGVGSAPFKGGWAAPVGGTRVDGRRLDTVTHRFWQTRQEHLLVGNDGISWVHDASGTVLSVDYARCTVLVVEGPQLTLFGENGTSIIVHRDYWRGGDIAVRDIQARVAADRIIRIEPPAATAS